MNIVIANACTGYFEILKDINERALKLSGADVYFDAGMYERETLDLIQLMPRIIPYKPKKINNEISMMLDENSGLIEFEEELCYLRDGYTDIIENHQVLLDSIRILRNKYQHKIHAIKFDLAHSSEGEPMEITYSIGNKKCLVKMEELLVVIKKLNVLFDKIVQETIECEEIKRVYGQYPYYKRLLRYDFLDYNAILNSSISFIIGKKLRCVF